MEDWHGVRRSMRDGDFEEEDVWSYGKERENSNPPMRKYRNSSVSSSSSSSSSWSFKSTAPRMIPNGGTHEQRFMFQQSSAPVNIPDWSKIYGKSFHHMGRNGSSCVHDHGDDGGGDDDDGGVGGGGDDDDDDGDGIVPPHEWIAKKLARTQISSSSMCEGIGRTLKGRDLSKVRNAVLTKTGFLE